MEVRELGSIGRAAERPLVEPREKRHVKSNVRAAPKTSASTGWPVLVGLLLLSVIPLVAGAFRLTQLAGGAAVTPDNARFVAAPAPVVLHIVGATVYAILGVFQLSDGVRRRRPGWHRAAGRLLVTCGLVVGLSGLWMTVFYPGPDRGNALLVAFRLLFGSAMVVSLVLGVATIRSRNIAGHRAWMTRACAIGLGAGTQVLTLLAGELIAGTPDGGLLRGGRPLRRALVVPVGGGRARSAGPCARRGPVPRP
jgi:uncharacterized membrane protein